jgi:hypothetical protein
MKPGDVIQELNWPIGFMKFTLTYDGPLPSGQNDSRSACKQKIRRQIHFQLIELFRTHPALGPSWFYRWDDDSAPDARKLVPVSIGPFKFLPFINSRLKMFCHLDILFLRPAAQGGIVGQGGDIDNRLKTLFDALRPPLETQELPATDIPGFNEAPFLCLMEDDSLIIGFSVTTERLLRVPCKPAPEPSDVRLVIDVTVKLAAVTWGTMGLGD